jgi:RNase P subunit RPR2
MKPPNDSPIIKPTPHVTIKRQRCPRCNQPAPKPYRIVRYADSEPKFEVHYCKCSCGQNQNYTIL